MYELRGIMTLETMVRRLQHEGQLQPGCTRKRKWVKTEVVALPTGAGVGAGGGAGAGAGAGGGGGGGGGGGNMDAVREGNGGGCWCGCRNT